MHKGHYLSICIIVINIMFSSCEESGTENQITNLDTTVINSLMDIYDIEDEPGAALLIINDGNILLARGYGLANLEDDIPITPATNFRLASVTKQFTGMCIMILVNWAQLEYEQTLTEIFPSFPDYGSDITVLNLLQHTSGLRDYFSLIPENTTEQIYDADVLALMMEQNSTYFPPGTEYRYSNSGYAVLAMIVEQVSGTGFAEFIELNIFSPLGMSYSIAYENGISEVENRAYGYSLVGTEYSRDDQSITSAVLGDGGVYSSLDDMSKWDQSLYTSQLVPYMILSQAFVTGTLLNGSETGYGFGWVLDNYNYRKRVYHTGNTRGFRNVFMRFPDERLSILILTNRNSGNPKETADQIATMFFGS